MLYNESHVRAYLRDTAPHVGQVERAFWPALDVMIRQLIDQAVRRNHHHRRLGASEILAGHIVGQGSSI